MATAGRSRGSSRHDAEMVKASRGGMYRMLGTVAHNVCRVSQLYSEPVDALVQRAVPARACRLPLQYKPLKDVQHDLCINFQ